MKCTLLFARFVVADLLIVLSSLAAVAQSVEKINFSGYGAAGLRFLDRNVLVESNQETYYEGKLQADIRVNKYVEAQLDFRGNSDDNVVELREFTAKLKIFELFNLKFGNTKKKFGLEQLQDRFELETVDRSIVNREISEFGYGGRAVSITVYNRYTKKDSGEFPATYYISLFKNNSKETGVTSRISYIFSRKLSLSTSVQAQHAGGDESINTFGVSGDVAFESDEWNASLEGFWVQDPQESVVRRLAGDNTKVSALGVKAAASFSIDLNDDIFRSMEPVFLVAWYAPDSERTAARTIQTLIGVNVYMHKKSRLRLNIDRLDTTNEFSNDSSTFDSRITLEFQVRF